ncbi:MAG: MBL fold metallo-hydrolase [Frankiaceae bacterium]
MSPGEGSRRPAPGRRAGQGGQGEEAGVRVTYLGHATVLIEMDGVRVLTDPLLRRRVGALVRLVPMADVKLTGIDAVLISHLHLDHCDLPSLAAVGRETPLIVPVGAGAFLRGRGFPRVTELAWGRFTDVGSVEVTATEAVHNGRRPIAGPRAQAAGYVLAGSGGEAVYFAGDTDLYPGMATLPGVRDGVDVALLPVWGWGPALGPGHLDPARAVEAATLIRPRHAMPIHAGTYYPAGLRRVYPRNIVEPPGDFARGVSARGLPTDVLVPRPGSVLVP